MTLSQRIRITAVLVAGVLPVTVTSAQEAVQLKHISLSHLEKRLPTIDSELKQLAQYSLRSGVGPVGYRSQTYDHGANTEWIRIELGQETPIDQIVLVPTIWRDTEKGFIADGFPLEFSVMAGTSDDLGGRVIASFGPQDHLLPRIAPLIVSCAGTTASWIRIEATALSPRAWDGKYILQLSEILVFNGEENIALQQSIQTSSSPISEGPARSARFLVDGFVPYLMNAYQGDQSIAFLGSSGMSEQPMLTIDLGTIRPLNRIHLHAVDLSDTVPMARPIGFGVPQRMRVQGATHPDFSDAVSLVDYHRQSVYDTGPIIMRRFQETACRYVRLIIVEPYMLDTVPGTSVIGFAEIHKVATWQSETCSTLSCARAPGVR